MKTLFLFLCGWLPAFFCAAQELPSATEQQLENLGEESPDDDALLQQLAFLQKHPVDLNTATANDLQQLRFLTPLQISNLLRYRRAFGKLINLYELQAVPGFDPATIRKILPYVIVSAATSVAETFASRLSGGDRYLLLRLTRVLEQAKGYSSGTGSRYLGDRNRLLLAGRYQYKNLLYYGFVADKDAGEQFFRGAQRAGFDFYSVHFFARNLGNLRALAVGDYTVNLGQGLTQWQGLAFGKGVDVLAIKRQSPTLLPYRSPGEFSFSRGVAATLGLGNWEATLFASYKKISGNLVGDSIDRFSSFNTAGYHRTAAEVADRYKLADLSAGGNLVFKKDLWRIGVNAVGHSFSRPMKKQNVSYNRFAFEGSRLFLTSVDYSFTFRNAHFFGEAAVDQAMHRAVLSGALLSLSPAVDASLLYRNLSPAYPSLFGNAFTENTLPANEQGFYTGILLRPALGWQIAAYADVYRFPFLKYRISTPGRGVDYLTQITYRPGKQVEIYLRYRTEAKPQDKSANPNPMATTALEQKQNLRFHFTAQLDQQWSVKGRTEMIWFDADKERQEGFLMFLEAAVRPQQSLNGSLRLQYFETDGFDSRLYAYESDMLYSFSIPAFSGKGFRWYLNANWKPTKNLEVWFRLAQTTYPGRTEIGSGLDELQGHRRTEGKLQLLYRL